MGRAATEALMQAAEVKRGMAVLDVACGTGDPALSLAAAVGSDGQVTATDLMPELVAAAEKGAQEQGLSNIAFRQADAEDLPFSDQTFDVVTCRHGVMFFPNVQRALKEVHRVLKPGGRAVFTALGPSEQQHTRIAQEVLRKYVEPRPPETGGLDPSRFAESGLLSAEMRQAGFHEVAEESLSVPWPWPGSVDEYWEFTREQFPGVRRLVALVPPDQWEQVNSAVLTTLALQHDGQQINFTACFILACGLR